MTEFTFFYTLLKNELFPNRKKSRDPTNFHSWARSVSTPQIDEPSDADLVYMSAMLEPPHIWSRLKTEGECERTSKTERSGIRSPDPSVFFVIATDTQRREEIYSEASSTPAGCVIASHCPESVIALTDVNPGYTCSPQNKCMSVWVGHAPTCPCSIFTPPPAPRHTGKECRERRSGAAGRVAACRTQFSLVAANKVFHCGVSRGPADTVSVLGVPVPGPDPADPQQPGQGQTLSGSKRMAGLPQRTGFWFLSSKKIERIEGRRERSCEQRTFPA
ncbi:hypothetical protein Q7C36_007241 [Tachysurus vachellii]|uniref:Uncharacterized protein n=1 Tax=Tachysurus vachellii TaxID=175792 RepID=A0AA88NFT4_TACVA|nr:hypothetical protein Q7C36_007241 [Tachysurus vachellii]